MPPKSATSKDPKASAKSQKPPKPQNIGSIEDLTIQRSLVARLVKSVLSEKTAVQKEALTSIQEASTVFVSFLCSAAHDEAAKDRRKGIQPKDIVKALQTTEFSAFIPRLEAELELLEAEAEAVNKGGKKAVTAKDAPIDAQADNDAEPQAKKPRGDGNALGADESADEYADEGIDDADEDPLEEVSGNEEEEEPQDIEEPQDEYDDEPREDHEEEGDEALDNVED